MLEIGVQNGGSLELWAGALPPGSEVVGIDIDPGCAKIALPANVRVLIGNAADAAFLQSALGAQTFDLIIDDGSHRSDDIVRSFQSLFPRLNPGGRYFIEDLHASYWREFGGGFREPGTAIEFLKSLIDALHADHLRPDVAVDAAERAALTALNREVARITFIDSLGVIEKYAATKARPFVRALAGARADEATPAWREYLTTWQEPLVIFDDAVRTGLDAHLLGTVAALRAELLIARDAAAKAEAQLGAANEAVRAGEATRQALDHALRAETQALAAARGEIAQQVEALHGLRQAHDALAQSHGELKQAHAVLRQAYAETRGRLKAIKRSWAWRLAWPVRWLERRMRR